MITNSTPYLLLTCSILLVIPESPKRRFFSSVFKYFLPFTKRATLPVSRDGSQALWLLCRQHPWTQKPLQPEGSHSLITLPQRKEMLKEEINIIWLNRTTTWGLKGTVKDYLPSLPVVSSEAQRSSTPKDFIFNLCISNSWDYLDFLVRIVPFNLIYIHT